MNGALADNYQRYCIHERLDVRQLPDRPGFNFIFLILIPDLILFFNSESNFNSFIFSFYNSNSHSNS